VISAGGKIRVCQKNQISVGGGGTEGKYHERWKVD